MERFLERLSLSELRTNFILKGGALVASVVGLDQRATLDLDASLRAIELNETSAIKFTKEIASIQLDDCVSFVVQGHEPLKTMPTILAFALCWMYCSTQCIHL